MIQAMLILAAQNAAVGTSAGIVQDGNNGLSGLCMHVMQCGMRAQSSNPKVNELSI